MTLLFVIGTFIVALLRGGRIRDLERLDIHHVWIFPLALILMIGLNYGKFNGWITEDMTLFAQPLIYVLILAGLWLNRQIEGVMLLAFGTFLNFFVIVVNGGYMPVSMDALKISGLTMKELGEVMYLRHIPMSDASRLWFLADIIPVPWPHKLRSVGSVGDLVILVAMVVIVWRLFFPSKTAQHGRLNQARTIDHSLKA